MQVKANTFQANAAAPYEPPAPWDKKFHLNGITITPGGFFAMEGVYRTHDTGGNFSPAFSSVPNYTNVPGHSNEIRGTAQQSRFSLLIQGNANPDTLISGYGEFDFLGAVGDCEFNGKQFLHAAHSSSLSRRSIGRAKGSTSSPVRPGLS